MQQVAFRLPTWEQTKTQSKRGLDTIWGWADKLSAPANRVADRIGSEAFWPTTLDKESHKAARILRSFCKNGFYTEETQDDQTGPSQTQRVLKKIPERVIQNAVGLAIFTTMRTGLWISGAGGSGVLVARLDDGSWSPPSGILLHTAEIEFRDGVDIYDCIIVINNREVLEAFTETRVTLGGEINAVAGPVGVDGIIEYDGKHKETNKLVFTYFKSRGCYAGIQADGAIIIERSDENARFYGEKISTHHILGGKASHPPPETKTLLEMLKVADGRIDVDEQLLGELEGQPTPGDVNIDAPSDGKTFGIPDPEDPDPFGVLALEKEGCDILDAATRSRPASQHFEYNPSTTSPTYELFHRKSVAASISRSSQDNYTLQPKAHNRWSEDRSSVASQSGTKTEPVTEDPVGIRALQKSECEDHKREVKKDTLENADTSFMRLDATLETKTFPQDDNSSTSEVIDINGLLFEDSSSTKMLMDNSSTSDVVDTNDLPFEDAASIKMVVHDESPSTHEVADISALSLDEELPINMIVQEDEPTTPEVVENNTTRLHGVPDTKHSKKENKLSYSEVVNGSAMSFSDTPDTEPDDDVSLSE